MVTAVRDRKTIFYTVYYAQMANKELRLHIIIMVMGLKKIGYVGRISFFFFEGEGGFMNLTVHVLEC